MTETNEAKFTAPLERDGANGSPVSLPRPLPPLPLSPLCAEPLFS